MLRRAEATRDLELPRELVYSVLTDYERYREWLPGVRQSRILAREGDVVVAELESSRWGGGRVVLELVESAPAAVSYVQVDHYGKPDVAGQCELAVGDGDGKVRVRAAIRLNTPLLRPGARRRLRSALGEALSALARRAGDLAAGERPSVGRRKILEIVRRPEGLEIQYLGETYLLPKAERGKLRA